MDPANQRILHYFIEESLEHLQTLENGLLDLGATVRDTERVNELFRAAHSVKGGAAMLGFASIQKTAHRLEDCFKILKENTVPVDQALESMFLQGFDTLKGLIEQLQSPYGLQEESAEQAVQQSEPTFAKLQAYLERLVSGGPAPSSGAKPTVNYVAQVTDVLKQMLTLFKQGPTPTTRQQLGGLCDRLNQLSPEATWQKLIGATKGAIANPKVPFNTLAPVVIKELKQAAELLQAGRSAEITTNASLQKCAVPVAAAPAAAAPVAAAAATGNGAVTMPSDPQAVAKLLIEKFNKQQLAVVAKILVQAIKT